VTIRVGIRSGIRAGIQSGINPGTDENETPLAAFSAVVDQHDVEFTDESTDDGTIVSWDWDFGDGNDSTDQHPSHTYVNAGTYNVQLTVTDDEAGTDDVTEQVVIPRFTIAVANKEAASGGTDGTTFTAGSVSLVAGSYLVIAIGAVGAAVQAVPTGVTATGLTFTKVTAEQVFSSNTRTISVWYALVPGGGFTGTVGIEFGSTVTRCGWILDQITGVKSTNPVNQARAATGSGTGPTTQTFSGALENAANLCYGAFCGDANPTSFAPSGGFNEHGEIAGGSGNVAVQAQSLIGATTCAATHASANTGLVIVEFIAG
jgi:PKD repeat protein